jgi:hypothetical protein
MLSRVATNINYIVFGLTQMGLKSTIYHIQGEQANYYTTDALEYIVEELFALLWLINFLSVLHISMMTVKLQNVLQYLIFLLFSFCFLLFLSEFLFLFL